ncbi:MAG: hypothetical protein J7K98_03135 [Candidatus Aenigmarchaeota archaeon]|nr:hypothetical protein [Candidatus Aenigmarchaeota archaeon]
MKAPLCKVCLESDILCNVCSKRVEEEKITQIEIKRIKKVYEIVKNNKEFENLEIKRILGINTIYIIVPKGHSKYFFIRNGFLLKKLSSVFKRPVKVVEESGDKRFFIQKLIQPATLIGLNVLYTPESKKYIVRIPYRERKFVNEKEVSQILSFLLPGELEIKFE